MSHRLNHTRKTVGIIINSIDSFSSFHILAGLSKVAEVKDLNLLFFVSSNLDRDIRTKIQMDIIYSNVKAKRFDALIIWSPSLTNYININEHEGFMKICNKIPVVCVGTPINEVTSITFDNRFNMVQLMDHLINHHKYSRIAFIYDSSNSDAKERFQAYKESLLNHNIPLDNNLIVNCDFANQTIFTCINELIKNNASLPQAIVAANDEIALTVYQYLKQLGYEIGKDIALTGFDNIRSAKYFYPPITTINQPFFNISVESMELISDMLDGLTVPKNNIIKGELIIRESCGCLPKNSEKYISSIKINQSKDLLSSDKFEDFEKTIRSNEELIIRETMSALKIIENQKAACRVFIYNLLNSFLEDISEQNKNNKFITTLNGILKYCIILIGHDCCFVDALNTFRSLIIKMTLDYKVLNLCNDLLYNASILLGDTMLKKEIMNEYRQIKIHRDSRDLLQNYNSAISAEEFISSIKAAMSCYEISQCYLCYFDNPITNINDNNLYFPNKINLQKVDNECNSCETSSFDPDIILPDKYFHQQRRQELILMPLFTKDSLFGYIVFEKSSSDGFLFETFRSQVSNTLKFRNLLDERIKAEEELNLAVTDLEKLNGELRSKYVIDELTGLLNRRGFMIHGGNLYNYSVENQSNFTLLFGDLDGLKIINDTFGHKEGDYALTTTAKLLDSCMENNDIVARLGGDEFTILSPNKSTIEEVNELINKITSAFNDYNSYSSKPYEVQISFGFSIYSPELNTTFESIIEDADKKLYEVKKKRKGLIITKNIINAT
ncbi:MAG: GGDEF domain-containing protein [Bacillota bacterium]|nr:GGDEF domain-containing protein [Bacillota bacterium]